MCLDVVLIIRFGKKSLQNYDFEGCENCPSVTGNGGTQV